MNVQAMTVLTATAYAAGLGASEGKESGRIAVDHGQRHYQSTDSLVLK